LPERSQLPYLLRAMLDWIVDNGWTPHLIVDARSDAVTVPRQFVTEGYIRLNISASATQSFRITDGAVEFSARFGGVSHHIHVPLEFVLAIVARENGQGMAFAADSHAADADEPTSDPSGNAGDTAEGQLQPPASPPDPEPPRPRPNLKLVK
jgi:stringent starvation protein B